MSLPAPIQQNLDLIEEAIRQRETVFFYYVRMDRAPEFRVFKPQGFAQGKDGQLLVRGFDLKKMAPREFAFAKMIHISVGKPRPRAKRKGRGAKGEEQRVKSKEQGVPAALAPVVNRRELLNERMLKAVAREDYEEAAKLRDEIKAMEEKA